VTHAILRALRDAGAPAIGFVNEIKIDSAGRPSSRGVSLLREWVDAGQTLGNHTYSHLWFYESDAQAFIADVVRGERVWRPLMEGTGPFTPYLRHPRLNTGPSAEERAAVERFLDSVGYVVAPVTIDNYDFLFANAYAGALRRDDGPQATSIGRAYLEYMDHVFAYYEEQSVAIVGYELPQILLLHANRLNADYLPALLQMIRTRGYEFITIDQALEDPAYSRSDGYVGRAGITWLHRWAITERMPRTVFAGEPTVPDWVQALAAAR